LLSVFPLQVFAIGQAAAVSMQVSDGGLGQRIANLSSSQVQAFEKVGWLYRSTCFIPQHIRSTFDFLLPSCTYYLQFHFPNNMTGPICIGHIVYSSIILLEIIQSRLYHSIYPGRAAPTLGKGGPGSNLHMGHYRSLRNFL